MLVPTAPRVRGVGDIQNAASFVVLGRAVIIAGGSFSHLQQVMVVSLFPITDGVLERLHQLCVLCQGPRAQHGAL